MLRERSRGEDRGKGNAKGKLGTPSRTGDGDHRILIGNGILPRFNRAPDRRHGIDLIQFSDILQPELSFCPLILVLTDCFQT